MFSSTEIKIFKTLSKQNVYKNHEVQGLKIENIVQTHRRKGQYNKEQCIIGCYELKKREREKDQTIFKLYNRKMIIKI